MVALYIAASIWFGTTQTDRTRRFLGATPVFAVLLSLQIKMIRLFQKRKEQSSTARNISNTIRR